MSPAPSRSGWTGCHGVRVVGDGFGFGSVTGDPLATVTVSRGEVTPPTGPTIWEQHGDAVLDGRRVGVDRVMRRRHDGVVVVSGSHDPFVAVDVARGVITLGPGRESAQRQMLASFALPLVLHATSALLVHAAACANGEGATLICGATGSGKSSSLTRLVDEGWSAVSEDVCALDLREGTPRVWPGPPWVRLLEGQRGPRDSAPLFASGDKTAWNIASVQPTEPIALTRIVVLDAPGGARPRREVIDTADAIRALAHHAVWLDDATARAPRLFGRVAHVATTVPMIRARMPRRDGWAHALPDLLARAPVS